MVDRSEALGLLPPAYSSAIELEAAGAGNAEIASVLAVDLDAIPALLRIGHAKLDRLIADRDVSPS